MHGFLILLSANILRLPSLQPPGTSAVRLVPAACFAVIERGKVGDENRALPERERKNFNHALFALAFFSRRQDRELLGAISRGLLVCPCRV